ncbi:hypothetical protein PP744_gp002 [Rhizobium phage RHph_N38]|uniref:Uncharacterized protein n=1 Tax=Rhizobium phage RHph_N38 TaxID=2509750 RepID=A0A7S5R9G1_9CAUD|nr:hypothetical protein PP744_gp002 [Rhizobium phage RHph_N38]QIG70465.1 hypothetical protein EVB89_002 [Rhizobium phage RHph_N38]
MYTIYTVQFESMFGKVECFIEEYQDGEVIRSKYIELTTLGL